MSDDSDIFNKQGKGLPLFEGKGIAQFDSHYTNNAYCVEESVGRKRLLGANPDRGQQLDYQKYRLGYRKIARNTDERTLISSIVPKFAFTGENLTTSKEQFDERILLFVCSVFNSLCQDFVVRLRVTMAVNIYHINQIPLPRIEKVNLMFGSLVARAARLIAVSDVFSDLWAAVFQSEWQNQCLWYPCGLTQNYGPIEEQDTRKRLKEQVTLLTPNWTEGCGVRDRLPGRRDSGDRAQLRAEIDAYVAHLYGLSRDYFAYILDTFPVLKRKEIQAFGEFRSKRKCLEEYDRIGPILEAKKSR